MSRRVLFVSFASYLDDASGAAIASRAMMEALARRSFLVEVLCGPILELGREIDLPAALADRNAAVELRRGGAAEVGEDRHRGAPPPPPTARPSSRRVAGSARRGPASPRPPAPAPDPSSVSWEGPVSPDSC